MTTPSSTKEALIKLFLFFLGGLFTFLFLWFGGLIHFGELDFGSCDDTERYTKVTEEITAKPISIPEINQGITDYYRQVHQYEILQNFTSPTNSQTNYEREEILDLREIGHEGKGSVFLSKKLLDDIFTEERSSNGVNLYFGLRDNDISVFVLPATSYRVNFIKSDQNIYELSSYCPPLCTY